MLFHRSLANMPQPQDTEIFSDTHFLVLVSFFLKIVLSHFYKVLVKSETRNIWSLTSCLPKDIEKNTIFVVLNMYFLDTISCEILGTYINLCVYPFVSAFPTHLSFDLISVKHRSCQFQSGHLAQNCAFDSVGFQILQGRDPQGKSVLKCCSLRCALLLIINK